MGAKDIKPHQFKPGQTGNPNGYSRGRRLTDQLLAMFEEQGIDAPFLKVGITAALKGDPRFWTYLYDRIEGKPHESRPPAEHAPEGKPRIKVPGRPGRKGGRPAKGGARKRKSAP